MSEALEPRARGDSGAPAPSSAQDMADAMADAAAAAATAADAALFASPEACAFGCARGSRCCRRARSARLLAARRAHDAARERRARRRHALPARARAAARRRAAAPRRHRARGRGLRARPGLDEEAAAARGRAECALRAWPAERAASEGHDAEKAALAIQRRLRGLLGRRAAQKKGVRARSASEEATIEKLFRRHDVNQDGVLSFDEFRALLAELTGESAAANDATALAVYNGAIDLSQKLREWQDEDAAHGKVDDDLSSLGTNTSGAAAAAPAPAPAPRTTKALSKKEEAEEELRLARSATITPEGLLAAPTRRAAGGLDAVARRKAAAREALQGLGQPGVRARRAHARQRRMAALASIFDHEVADDEIALEDLYSTTSPPTPPTRAPRRTRAGSAVVDTAPLNAAGRLGGARASATRSPPCVAHVGGGSWWSGRWTSRVVGGSAFRAVLRAMPCGRHDMYNTGIRTCHHPWVRHAPPAPLPVLLFQIK